MIRLSPAEREALLRRIIADRVPDLRFLVDSLLTLPDDGISEQMDSSHIGLIGWSCGGWAALAAPELDVAQAVVSASR